MWRRTLARSFGDTELDGDDRAKLDMLDQYMQGAGDAPEDGASGGDGSPARMPTRVEDVFSPAVESQQLRACPAAHLRARARRRSISSWSSLQPPPREAGCPTRSWPARPRPGSEAPKWKCRMCVQLVGGRVPWHTNT